MWQTKLVSCCLPNDFFGIQLNGKRLLVTQKINQQKCPCTGAKWIHVNAYIPKVIRSGRLGFMFFCYRMIGFFSIYYKSLKEKKVPFCIMKTWLNQKERFFLELYESYLGYGPFPVTVTTRIITFLVGNPYNPLFATVTGKGPHPSHTSLEG